MTDAVRPGKDHLADYRGAEPKPGEDPSDRATPPVNDDPGPDRRVPDNPDPGNDPPPPSDDGNERAEPKGPPSDDARSKIFARFEKNRPDDPPPDDGAEDPPPADGKQPDPNEKAPSPGPSSFEEPDPNKLTLKVDGKSIAKSIDEIAVLADLSPEEVRASPQAAIRIAQREIASNNRLEEAKRIRREVIARPTDDAVDQPARTAPHQEPGKTGKTKDGPDQPDGARDTSEPDLTALAESLQLEDPKDAGPKLKDALDRLTDKKVSKAVETALSTQAADDRLRNDGQNIRKAMNGFMEDHQEVVGNRYLAPAIATALIDEYRDDIRTAMAADGYSQDEIDDAIKVATPDEISRAHQKRRLAGDPNVRVIDKGMIEKAYDRVTQAIGIKTAERSPPQQDLATQRRERKAALPIQPKRASAPPATTTPPAREPITRSSAVAEMRQARGQKSPTAR